MVALEGIQLVGEELHLLIQTTPTAVECRHRYPRACSDRFPALIYELLCQCEHVHFIPRICSPLREQSKNTAARREPVRASAEFEQCARQRFASWESSRNP